jgi:hypothetical protein
MPKHAIASGALLALCAGPALADLSAEALWADWQQMYRAMGQTLTAETEDYADGRLTLGGLTTASSMAGVEGSTRFGDVALVELDDGSVSIELPAAMTIESTTTMQGETVEQTVVMETEGWSGIVREVDDTRVYDLDAASMTYRFDDTSGEEPVTASVAFQGMAADYVTREDGAATRFEQELLAESMTVRAQSEGEDPFDLTYVLDTVASQASGSLDMTTAGEGMGLSEIGLVITGNLTHAGATTILAGKAQAGPFTYEGTSESGRIGFGIDEDALSYELASSGAEMSVSLAAFPVPLEASLSEVTSSITLPMGVSDDPKDFGMSVALRELTLDDQIWSLFDPTGQLPREPATLALALDGSALMRADIFGDPEAMMALGGPPGELRSLDLTELLVSIAGAELTGEGSVTFPNPGPIPQPVGTVTLNLAGAFGLMDSLVALGFVPAEQAAFVRGMSGMVAEQVGEDQLRSVIEFTEGGGITANGMPLR